MITEKAYLNVACDITKRILLNYNNVVFTDIVGTCLHTSQQISICSYTSLYSGVGKGI